MVAHTHSPSKGDTPGSWFQISKKRNAVSKNKVENFEEQLKLTSGFHTHAETQAHTHAHRDIQLKNKVSHGGKRKRSEPGLASCFSLGTLWDAWGPGRSGDLQVRHHMTSAIYLNCVVLRAGYEPHLTGPKRGASDAVGKDSSSPGSCQPARPTLRFSGMLAAAHTLTTIPRDLLPRLLFPDAPNLRNEYRGRDKSPAKGHKEPISCRPASSHQRAAGRLRAVPKAGAR